MADILLMQSCRASQKLANRDPRSSVNKSWAPLACLWPEGAKQPIAFCMEIHFLHKFFFFYRISYILFSIRFYFFIIILAAFMLTRFVKFLFFFFNFCICNFSLSVLLILFLFHFFYFCVCWFIGISIDRQMLKICFANFSFH